MPPAKVSDQLDPATSLGLASEGHAFVGRRVRSRAVVVGGIGQKHAAPPVHLSAGKWPSRRRGAILVNLSRLRGPATTEN